MFVSDVVNMEETLNMEEAFQILAEFKRNKQAVLDQCHQALHEGVCPHSHQVLHEGSYVCTDCG